MASSVEGYVYVEEGGGGAMAGARVGVTVRLRERRVPWIVVCHSIERVLVSRWPGRLWRVRVVDVEGIEQVGPEAGYTRAFSVEVLEKVPAWRVFGRHGRAVAAVIEAARGLELSEVDALEAARSPGAKDAYSRAWGRWLAAVGRVRPEGERHEGTLGVPDVRGAMSPVNEGFVVVSYAVTERAEELVGSAAFEVDEEEERYLGSRWSAASAALLDAAMACGAPEVVEGRDRDVLMAAWRAVYGDDPAAD